MVLGCQPKLRLSWIARSGLPRSPGHPFCAALNRLLAEAEFDLFVEELCACYADNVGCPGIVAGGDLPLTCRRSLYSPQRALARMGSCPIHDPNPARLACKWAASVASSDCTPPAPPRPARGEGHGADCLALIDPRLLCIRHIAGPRGTSPGGLHAGPTS